MVLHVKAYNVLLFYNNPCLKLKSWSRILRHLLLHHYIKLNIQEAGPTTGCCILPGLPWKLKILCHIQTWCRSTGQHVKGLTGWVPLCSFILEALKMIQLSAVCQLPDRGRMILLVVQVMTNEFIVHSKLYLPDHKSQAKDGNLTCCILPLFFFFTFGSTHCSHMFSNFTSKMH